MKSIKLPSSIERLLGVTPVPSPPHVFSLDRHELRYGAFHRGPQGFTFDACRREVLPEDLFQHGVLGGPLREPRAFWEILQGFVSRLPAPVKEASLILPDSWLRLTFTESTDLPRRRAERQEVLRFKLKRLVPFRVEELRVSATEVTPFPEQKEPLRLLLGFAVEQLLTQLEDAFAGVGIALGQITNVTLALLAALESTVAKDELAALVLVEPEAFTLSFIYGGEPVLHRYKAFGEEGSEVDARDIDPSVVRRDLRLTSSFLRQHFPEWTLGRVFVAAPPGSEDAWLTWVEAELGVAAEALGFEHLPLARTQVGESWMVTAPLLGATAIEVS